MSSNHNSLEKLGKFVFIDRFAKKLQSSHSSIQDLGEDAAMLAENSDYRLMTSHLLLEGVHFDLTYFPLKHLGYKAVTMSVSAIVAMNGVADQLTINIAVENEFSLEALEEILAGVTLGCEKYQVNLGKIAVQPSKTGLVIATTMAGKVSKDHICLRKGAKVHDLICVTGDLGAAYVGLQVLNREKQVWQVDPNMQPDLAPYQYLLRRQLQPEARADITKKIDTLQVVPTAMTDIADGLAAALWHMVQAAQLGATIYEERLPIAHETYETAVSFNLDPSICALNGGEDYELMFTINQKDFHKLEHHSDIAVIGYITEQSQGINLMTNSGSMVPLIAPGWEGVGHTK
jgi:thiamine-monophosphate kinase